MDKNSIIALILIGLIILFIPYYQRLIQPNAGAVQNQEQAVSDTTTHAVDSSLAQEKPPVVEPKANEKKKISSQGVTPVEETVNTPSDFSDQDSTEREIIIDTDLIHAVVSNKGGGSLKSFVLKKYETYDSSYVNFIDSTLLNNTFFAFVDRSGKLVNTADVLFKSAKAGIKKFVEKDQTFSILFTVKYKGVTIERILTFFGDKYHFDVALKIADPQKILLNNQYQLGWINGIPLTEAYKREDNSYSHAYAYMAEELEDYKIDKKGKQNPLNLTGSADWTAIRTKYFLMSVINNNSKNVIDGVLLGGEGIPKKDYVFGKYTVLFNARYNAQADNTFRYYLGPLDYAELKTYGKDLQKLVLNNGWYERSLRFFSIPVLYILAFMHKFIPNYGIVIILFSIIIKLVLYPLTKKSYESMRDMQKIQPLMNELRAKYKNDPQRLNKEMVKLYKEYGVNPMGGCLPMLLQLPLLFALYVVFRSTIQLRGAVFIPGWINDLSRPEGLFHLPFSLPFYGNEFNLLPVLMAITMIFQSKMTTQDPKQKAMIYIMPIFMLLIFNQLSSGLNLYYTMFNLLTIIQQLYINRGLKDGPELVPATSGAKAKKKK